MSFVESHPIFGRRHFAKLLLQVFCARGLLSYSFARDAVAGAPRPETRRWLIDLNSHCELVKSGSVSPEAWQDGIRSLYSRYPMKDILAFIDLPRLLSGVTYPDDMALVRDVQIPVITGLPRTLRFGHTVFALKRGAAVIPHAHNNMVSAHLVLSGAFHVRTYQRIKDGPGHLLLKPSIDRTFGPGELLTMSDDRDNVHWLVARTDHAFTFDTPVVNLTPGKVYATPANEWSMIHVDPTARPESDGLIRAPVIEFGEGIRRFGHQG